MKKLSLTLLMSAMTALGGFSQTDSLPQLKIDSVDYFLLTRPQAEEAAKIILSLDQCLINESIYKEEVIELRLMDKLAIDRAREWDIQSKSYNEEIKLLNESLEIVKDDLSKQNKRLKFFKVCIPVSFGVGVMSTLYLVNNFRVI